MTTTNGEDNENSLELDKEKKNKKKKAKSEEEFVVMENKVEDPNGISKFKISEPLREKLKEKGIESLFPIQAMTFDIILQGCDLVGRARTGQGKTLAFVLPILESVTNGKAKETNAKTKETNGNARESRKGGYGGPPKPSVLVL